MDKSKVLLRDTLYKELIKFFSVLEELSGLVGNQVSVSLGNFMTESKEKAFSSGEFSENKSQWVLGVVFFILMTYDMEFTGNTHSSSATLSLYPVETLSN